MTTDRFHARASEGATTMSLALDVQRRSLIVATGDHAAHKHQPLVLLELGSWTLSALDAKLSALARTRMSMAGRVAMWAEALLGTPTFPESSLPALGRYQIRVRLQSLDCITFIYTCLALARAKDVDGFVFELASLRYAELPTRGVDNDATHGNFLHFACESLLVYAERDGLLRDVTSTFLAESQQSTTLSTLLTSHPRETRLDPDRSEVRPFLGERLFERTFIASDALRSAFSRHLQRGDIVLASKGSGRSTLIHHCFVATQSPSPLSYIHASFSGYYFTPPAKQQLSDDPGLFSIYQCGVSHGAAYAGDAHIVETDERLMHPYLAGTDRTLDDAIEHTFSAALVLRPQ